jgi:hypothetical protein
MASPRRATHVIARLRGPLFVAMLVGPTLSGCITGDRPSFEDDQPADGGTGNAAIDDVLDRLDSAALADFTADYDIFTKLGSTTTAATVVQAPPGRRSVTVGQIRFIEDDRQDATCDLSTAECQASIDDARISDVGITHRFYAEDFARRLRVDANRRIGEPVAYSVTAGAEQALCVDVPVSGGTKVYCAIESGILALYDGNDVNIELVGYTDIPDESAFETG